MSYRVDSFGDPVTFESGSNVLVSGDTFVTNERLFDAIVPDEDEQAIVITANLDVQSVISELQNRDVDLENVGIIDCTTTDSERTDIDLKPLNSPGDLTGISLEFAKLLENHGESKVRIGMLSLSTTLMYTELRTLFRFLHVFTARIRSGGMFGVFSMDPGMHEEQATNTIRAVFDAEARVTDSDEVTLRGSGFT